MNRSGPFLLLLVAIASFALTGPVIKWLISRGGEAISPCNVLFVGNLCAGLLTLAIARPRRVVKELRAVPRGGWTSLITPILSIVFAMILVGERPGTAQIVGGVIILVGMFIAGRDRAPVTETTMEKGLAAA